MNGSSRAARSVLAALALIAPFLVAATTASAAPPQPVEYDALGDSYASGYGVPPYGECGRSRSAYPVQVDGRMRIALDDFAACAGATTADLLSEQLDALDEDTDLVTITVGGNDIGWSTAVVSCLAGSDDQCAGALDLTRQRIVSQLPGLLESAYAQVAARAPNAQVVVTGYPRLFSPEHGPFLGASTAEQEALNDGADLLNEVIAEAAAGHGFGFVDVTDRFRGHGVNAPRPWILGPSDPGAFHPDTAGYRAYTAAVTAAINPSQLR